MTCSLCLHLSPSRFCPDAHDVVPVDFIDTDNTCPHAKQISPLSLIERLLVPGELLQPLWELGEYLEGKPYIDEERRDIAIQRLSVHAKNRQIAFIIDEVLKSSL